MIIFLFLKTRPPYKILKTRTLKSQKHLTQHKEFFVFSLKKKTSNNSQLVTLDST